MIIALGDMITVRGRFHRSVQLARDWHEPGSLQEYLLTPTGRDLAVQILRSVVAPHAAKAWSITGPYGSGKSGFALFLADLLSRQPAVHPDAVQVRYQAQFELPPFLPVLVVGQRGPLVPILLGTLARSVHSIDPTLADAIEIAANRPTVLDDEVISLFERTAERIHRAGKGGLLVILDEFGKFLEHGALHPDQVDLLVIQHLAELATRSTTPIVLITILHSSFADYLHRVDEVQRVEWQKVQGRFVDVAYREPIDQVIKLIGVAIEPCFPPQLAAAYDRFFSKLIEAPALAEIHRLANIRELLPNCAPIHPIAALMLPPLFRSKLAQNERSLFAFLASQEPFGLQDFLAQAVWEGGQPPLYRIDGFYDYVTAALGTTVYLGDRAHRWAEVANALERVPADAPPLTTAIIKTIGLLGLYGAQVGLKASEEVLTLALDDASGVQQALAYLKQLSVVVYRRHQQAYGLWEGSDVDIESRLEEARLQVGQGSLAQRLREAVGELTAIKGENAGVRQIVARAHYIRTGTLRFFQVDLVDGTAQALRNALSSALSPGNGQILYVLTSSPQDRTDLMALARELTKDVSAQMRLRILAFPKPIRGLEEALETIEAWTWVLQNTPALEGDQVARQEVRARILYARDWLETTAGQILGLRGHLFDASASEWIHTGETQPTRSAKEQLAWLSELCDAVFHQAPPFRNELLNRERLSAAAAKARRNLLEAMLQHALEPSLGLTGYPPEVSMYRSLLRDGGFHQPTETGWGFGPPEPAWRPLWEAIDAFLLMTHRGPRPLVELVQMLQQPPFGLREGPVPVLLCAALLARREDVALYEDGLFIPELRIEVFERLTRVPSAFAIQHFSFSVEEQARLESLHDLVRTLNLPAENGAGGPLLSIVKPLVLFAAQLPPYSKATRRTQPPKAAAVRDALLRSRDPYALVMIELPAAMEITSPVNGDVSLLAETLRECIDGLQDAYPSLLTDIEYEIRATFDLYGTLEETCDQLQARARPLVGRSGDRTLALFVHEAGQLNGRDWREVLGRVVNNGLPPDHWRDTDTFAFRTRLRLLASEFFRLEELAAEQRQSGALQVLRIGVLDGQVQEAREIVSITPKRAEIVETLAEQITHLLEAQTDDGEESRRVCLAALTQVATRYLRPSEDLSRG